MACYTKAVTSQLAEVVKHWWVCLQLSFEEGQTSQGHFTLTLQLKNDREACLYRPGVGQVCAYQLR